MSSLKTAYRFRFAWFLLRKKVNPCGCLAILSFVVALGFGSPPSVSGQPATVPGLISPVKMTVSAPDKPLELLDEWRLTVTIQNVSSDSITLKGLQWLVPPQLKSTRKIDKIGQVTKVTTATPPSGGNDDSESSPRGASTLSQGSWDDNFLPEESALGPGQVTVYQMTMPSTAGSGECWLFNPTILTWHYRELYVPILATYKTGGTSGIAGTITETIKVQWQTPFRTLVFGGILGALLAMTFYYLYLRLDVVNKYFAAIKDNPSLVAQNKLAIVSGLRQALALSAPQHRYIAWCQMLTACVTVIIVLLLIASGKESILPISITVNDFAGAAFLGLIAHKIGKVTFDVIFNSNTPVPGLTTQPSVSKPVLKAVWNDPVKKAILSWSAQKLPLPASYSVRTLALLTDDPSKAKVVKDVPTGGPFQVETVEGLTNPGDKAHFILVVKQTDGTETASAPVTVERPGT